MGISNDIIIDIRLFENIVSSDYKSELIIGDTVKTQSTKVDILSGMNISDQVISNVIDVELDIKIFEKKRRN